MTGRTNEHMQDATSRLTLIHPSQPLAAQFLQLASAPLSAQSHSHFHRLVSASTDHFVRHEVDAVHLVGMAWEIYSDLVCP